MKKNVLQKYESLFAQEPNMPKGLLSEFRKFLISQIIKNNGKFTYGHL